MKYFCRFIMKLLGWKAVGGKVPEDKAIILGVPHTSAWDFIISYFFYTSLGGKAYIMVKKEFFWGPLSPILKALGGLPVDRKHGARVTMQVIEAMESRKELHLAIAPEATRHLTDRWKTGFHTIARACNLDHVYLGYFDWGTKRISVGEKFMLSDNASEDLKKIMARYAEMNLHGKNKGCFSTGNGNVV
ncbi:MAG: 1-acyl-sn-glycerol-3-phosphate acyltransferase [Bacteroidales bacterium]|jgi:1-acyl-sn-glycerol-3-phosphate acyltransferase|nr:1-acyl-sn-glycerol-3-phosphate acyltransferase [Bacteroidales bacterium]